MSNPAQSLQTLAVLIPTVRPFSPPFEQLLDQ